MWTVLPINTSCATEVIEKASEPGDQVKRNFPISLLLTTSNPSPPFCRKLPEPRGGGRRQPRPHEPRGTLQAHDVSAQRARVLRGAAATPLPASKQHGSARSRSVHKALSCCLILIFPHSTDFSILNSRFRNSYIKDLEVSFCSL